MKKCLICQAEYGEDKDICSIDNTNLVTDFSKVFLGKVINDKYLLDKLLGVGGMGYVYRAKHLQLNIYVAVKILNPDHNYGRTIVERFRREALAALAVDHPNAIKVMDFGVFEGNVCYLAMEFLEGTNLKQIIEREEILSLDAAQRIFTKVFAAVSAAHNKNILHRDLKPENIFVCDYNSKKEVVKVLDFSIAKILDNEHKANSLTEAGVIIGTPAYMSPEQAQGFDLDEKSDIYSLGICLYEAFTGDTPFKGNTPMSIMLKQIHMLPRSLRENNPQIPASVEAIIMKAISKNPKDRFSNVKEFSEAFVEAIEFDKNSLITSEVKLDLSTNQKRIDTNPEINRLTLSQTNPVTDHNHNNIASYNLHTFKQNDMVNLPLLLETNTILETKSDPPSTLSSSTFLSARKFFALSLSILIVSMLLVTGGYIFVVMRKQENAFVESLQLSMVFIKGNSFSMGRNPGPNVEDDETPAHQVTVPDFWLGKYEVTNKQYQTFVISEDYPAPSNWNGINFLPGTEDYPITNISWNDANNYCSWLNKQNSSNYVFRLPTEAEWEYAARGVGNQLYPWGDVWSDSRTVSGLSQVSKPVAVNSQELKNDVSPFNIIGLAGNVTEWTSSDYYIYPESKAKFDPKAVNCKILRGGNYLSEKTALTTSCRPSWYPSNFKDERVGFRVAADVKANSGELINLAN